MKRFLAVTGMVACLAVGPVASASASDIVQVHKCPAGYEGAIVEVDGHYASVCQNILP